MMRISSYILAVMFLFHYEVVQAAPAQDLRGKVNIDGSSTVYPITEAVAEEFRSVQGGVQVTVGISGTGGGFKKFVVGELDISDASRPIKKEEIEAATKGGVEYIELPIAYDALTVVVNKKNTWLKSLTVKDLKKMWEPEAQGKVLTWKSVRAEWPDKPLKLYGPGVDSGTYDYFTEVVVGKAKSSRGDYTSSEDDNMIVQGVSSDENALGFFGLAYFQENEGKLRAVPIDDENDANGKGPQVASLDTVKQGVYQPLARPLFIYVRKQALEQPQVHAFVKFYLSQVPTLAEEVGYIPLEPSVMTLTQQRFDKGSHGSLFSDPKAIAGLTLEQIMSRGKAG